MHGTQGYNNSDHKGRDDGHHREDHDDGYPHDEDHESHDMSDADEQQLLDDRSSFEIMGGDEQWPKIEESRQKQQQK